MAVSVFDLFKIGIGPSQLAHGGPDARRAHVRRAPRARGPAGAHGARAGRAVRLARRHRQGPRQRQGRAAGPGRPRARHGRRRRRCRACSTPSARSTACTARRHARDRVRRGGRPRHAPPRDPALPRQRHALHRVRRRRRRARRTASTTRSAAASWSATRWRPTARRQKAIAPDTTVLPYPFHSGDELLRADAREHGISIAELMRRNERHWRTDDEIDAGLMKIWQRDAGLRARAAAAPRASCPAASRSSAAPPQLYRDADRQPRGRAARPAAGDGLGQPLRAGRQRGERRRRPRRHRAHQRRRRHRARRAALLHALRAGRQRHAASSTSCSPPRRSASSTRRTRRSRGAEVGCQGEVGVACSMAAGAPRAP